MKSDWDGKELQLNRQCWAVEVEDNDGFTFIGRPCSTRQGARNMASALRAATLYVKRATVIKVCVIRDLDIFPHDKRQLGP